MVESWDTFFVAETAAAAALLGLLFVAVSINLKEIVQSGGLADRAMGALMLLLAILIIGLLLAMPDQAVSVMGSETAGVTVFVAIITTMLGFRGLRASDAQYRRNFIQNIASNIIVLVPIFVGGLLMLNGGGETGFYWVGVGMCLTLIKAVSEGWIFLVEIMR